MGLLAVDTNDAGITVLSEDGIVYREPGYALLDEDGLTTGNDAFAHARLDPRRIHNRFWSELTTDALPDRRFRHMSAADLVSRQLEQLWRSARSKGDRLILSVPAYMDSDNLGLLLGICNELGLPVVGMVDAAVAATRREYVNASPVHVDLSLHSALLCRLQQPGQVRSDKAAVADDAGIVALNDAWIGVIADAFIRQSRFDPLHTAETEQLLLEGLPAWLAAASAGGSVALDIRYRGIDHHAELDALTLIAAAAPVYQRIVSQLRALCRVDETPALLLTERAARMPGLADMLTARIGGEIFLMETAAGARGLLTRCRDLERGEKISLVRSLPWDQSAVEVEVAATSSESGRPTHLLHGSVAHALGEAPLGIGSQPADGEHRITLDSSMPGVSRQHCSIVYENGQCVVRDHSRYGTFLNGVRIDGSAVLQVGDLLRAGTPGFEMQLITTEAGDGA